MLISIVGYKQKNARETMELYIINFFSGCFSSCVFCSFFCVFNVWLSWI